MMYLRWMSLFVLDLVLLPISYALAPILSLFTSSGWPSWGSWFWTFDNPPQGDGGYQTKHAMYIPAKTPWELYVNRVFWLWRNPCYGMQKQMSVKNSDDLEVKVIWFWGYGVNTSDQKKKPGGYYAECVDEFGDAVAFELYIVAPWSRSFCFRLRFGWKLLSRKFTDDGFAPFVDTVNPVDSYGDK